MLYLTYRFVNRGIEMITYLDCCSTTPIDKRVQEIVIKYMVEEFGNAGSRTHEYGLKAKKAVNIARKQVADVVDSKPEEVIFTSGATESNNIAILGLKEYGEKHNLKHIITTPIEHKSILEPINFLKRNGFEVTYLPIGINGRVNSEDLEKELRDDTLLVSIMHVNNETGIIQPLNELADILEDHKAFFHTDAAQGFGKEQHQLINPRIDMISISGHKLYAPKGVGALITRRRGYYSIPLKPLMFGGGQERGIRPGTQPVHLIAGLGLSAELAKKEYKEREEKCLEIRKEILIQLKDKNIIKNGDQAHCIPHVLNFAIPGLDSETAILKLKGKVAISNGSACTSQSYEPSHVLTAMGIDANIIDSSLRISWSSSTPTTLLKNFLS